jgi:hypothetical protein
LVFEKKKRSWNSFYNIEGENFLHTKTEICSWKKFAFRDFHTSDHAKDWKFSWIFVWLPACLRNEFIPLGNFRGVFVTRTQKKIDSAKASMKNKLFE